MTGLTDKAVKALLDCATQGPWAADGYPQNRIIWSPNGNRVCFMAHSSGLNDDRDIATSNLAAAAPDLARALLEARAECDGAHMIIATERTEVVRLRAENARLRADAQADPAWKSMADWSGLPDVYVTKVECQDGIVWRIEACSVPMAIGPEVRLVLADKARADAQAAVALVVEKAARICEPTQPLPAKKPTMADDPMGLFAYEVSEMAFEDAAEIRALAPVDGLSEVEALRKERDEFWRVSETLDQMQAEEAARADRLAATLAAAQAQIEALVVASRNASETWRRHGGISIGQMDDIHAALAALPAKEVE